MTCTCGHEYDEHEAGGRACEAVIEDEERQFVACPCCSFEHDPDTPADADSRAD